MGGQHPLFWDSCDGNCCCKKNPRGCHPFAASCTIPCLGSGAPDGSLLIMLRKYPSERHLLISDCSCGSEEQASCCQTGIVHMQSPASTAEEKQQTLCAWMQSINFNKPFTQKGASCLPFSACVYHSAMLCCVSKLILYPWLEFMSPASKQGSILEMPLCLHTWT